MLPFVLGIGALWLFSASSRPPRRDDAAGEVVSGPWEFWSDLFGGRDPVAEDRRRREAARAAEEARRRADAERDAAARAAAESASAAARAPATPAPRRRPGSGLSASVLRASSRSLFGRPRRVTPVRPAPRRLPVAPAVVPSVPGSAAPLAALPSTPTECAAAAPEVIAAGPPELIAWWLDCPGRTGDDAATLAGLLLEAGREADAVAVLSLLEGGAS